MSKIVYVLTNPVVPGVLKIGKTDRDDVAKRVKELFTTGVPVPFDCVYAANVKDNTETEQTLHKKFASQRINPKREFFWLSPKEAVDALKKYEVNDNTHEVRDIADGIIPEEEKNARWEARQKILQKYPEYADGKTMHDGVDD